MFTRIFLTLSLRLIAALLLVQFSCALFAQSDAVKARVDIDDSHLGEKIDMAMGFVDEDGKAIDLKKIANGKPLVLALVYYQCTSICSPFLNGVVDTLSEAPKSFTPGEDYSIVSLSFNHEEGPALAKGKKDTYLKELARKGKIIPESSWRFLTGSEENIAKLTKSVGFSFMKDGEDFRHTTSLIVLAPDGTISRYLPGTATLPLDLMMGVMDASEGKWSPTISKFIRFCFKKTPAGQGYAFDFLKVVGTIVLSSLFIFFLSLVFLVKRGAVHQDQEALNE